MIVNAVNVFQHDKVGAVACIDRDLFSILYKLVSHPLETVARVN